MNVLNLKTWSERRQVVAVILMAGAVIFMLYCFLLLPLARKRSDMEKEIEKMSSQLARKGLPLDEESLKIKKEEEEELSRSLQKEWVDMASRLAAFPNQKKLVESHVGHIDFKVALFNVRRRLLRKSKARNIPLPRDLGMDSEVYSDEDARKLMLQIRTVEKLVDLALDLKINMLRHVEPLLPIRHETGEGKEIFLEEYPVRVMFYGNLNNLFDLFHAMNEPQHIFVLRRLRIEEASRNRPDLLSIDAVISSLLFLKDPDELTPVPQKTVRRTRPMGI